MRYLIPKADLTFKRVFGEHPDLVMSLLNALLPLDAGQEIADIEYLPAEMVPDNPLRKNSIVDVRCRDKAGRQFIVEMQMIWSQEFECRVSLHDSEACVYQIGVKKEYQLPLPVYSLNFSDKAFRPALEGFYHYYPLVREENTDKVIDGLHLVFVELPKFNPQAYNERRMQVLWLRYLTEIKEQAREVPAGLQENPEVKKAIAALEESTYTEAQLYSHEKFWDIISVEKTLFNSAERRGFKQGLEEAQKQRMEKGMKQKEIEVARKMKSDGLPTDIISKYTGLSADEIAKI
mgnify:CR=1 FL=1